LAIRYGRPQRPHAIEPFAGSAGYSTFWEPPNVTLIDINPTIIGVWQYLIKVKPAEVMRLPVVDALDELPAWVCEEARSLIGFWLGKAQMRPARQRTPWVRRPCNFANSWSETKKCRIAYQVELIRHWKIIYGSYEAAPDVEGHWFVDPPYSSDEGRRYMHHEIDYETLATWCHSREGFVQICENDKASWGGLPFRPLTITRAARSDKRRVVSEYLCELNF
jgi:hypothetical protein